MPRHFRRLALLHGLLALPALAAANAAPAPAAPSLPTQLFISPAGEPFRAGPGQPYPVVNWFAGADANRDGKLTEAEFTIDTVRFFATLDLDHDQQLGSDEIKRYETDIAPEVRTGEFSSIDWNVRGGPGRARQPKLGLMQIQTDDLQAHVPELWRRRDDGYAGSGGAKYGIISIPEPILGMDTDLNGTVTQREMRAAAQRRFRLLDTEERNYLLLAELPEPYAQSHPSKARKRR